MRAWLVCVVLVGSVGCNGCHPTAVLPPGGDDDLADPVGADLGDVDAAHGHADLKHHDLTATGDAATAPDDLATVGGADLSSIVIPPGSDILFDVARTRGAMFSSAIQLRDFTGDKHLDVIGLNHWDDRIEIQSGDGKGHFADALTTDHMHGSTDGYIVADIDDDGDLDIALPGAAKSFDWFVNDGAGAFTKGTTTTFPATLGTIVVIDINGDHRDDLVSNVYGTISVYLAKAGGGFDLSPHTSTCLNAGDKGTAVGDYDGDHQLDVAVLAGTQIQICRGDGTGAFSAKTGDKYTVTGGSWSSSYLLGATRPDASGHSRLAVSSYQGGLLMDDIAAGAPVNPRTLPTVMGYDTWFLAGLSLDGGTTQHLVMEAWDGGSDYNLRVYAIGASTFTLVGNYAWDSGTLAFGDVDEDGVLDLVKNGGFEIDVIRARGDGSLHAAPKWPGDTFGAATYVVDVDHDGRADIVAAGESSNAGAPIRIDVLLAQPDGTLMPQTPIYVPAAQFGALTVADYDHDGDVDLVLSRLSPNELDWLRGDGHGAFAAPAKLRDKPGAVRAAELDGDDHVDLVQTTAGSLDVWLSTKGSWQSISGYSSPAWCLLADVDGDTLPDLVVTDGYDAQAKVWFLRGNGDGTFAAGVASTSVFGYGTVLADVDHDGDLDAISPAGGLSVYLFDKPTSTFGAPIVTTGTKLMYLRDLEVADFDGDHYPDVAYSGGYGLEVLKGDGKGAFAPAFEFPIGYVESVALGDLDGDGRIDLVGNGEGIWFARNITGTP